jgi:hypothetical protein
MPVIRPANSEGLELPGSKKVTASARTLGGQLLKTRLSTHFEAKFQEATEPCRSGMEIMRVCHNGHNFRINPLNCTRIAAFPAIGALRHELSWTHYRHLSA